MNLANLGFVLILATSNVAQPIWQIHFQGKLRSIMMGEDYSSHISLSALKDQSHLYALGVMEDLRGEAQIFDGHSLTTRVQKGKVVVDTTYSGNAALLVWSQVPAWKTIRTDDSCTDLTGLADIIEKLAPQVGLDPDSAEFPFLLRTRLVSGVCHVIDPGTKVVKFKTHEEMKAAGWHGDLKDADVEILGFFSKHAAGDWTHHDTYIHAHMRLLDNSLAGHLDSLTTKGLMVLSLPASR